MQLSSTHRIIYQSNRVCFVTKINYVLLIKLNIIKNVTILSNFVTAKIFHLMWFVDIFEDVDMLKGRDTRSQASGLEGLNPGEDSGYYTMWPLGIVLIGFFCFLL